MLQMHTRKATWSSVSRNLIMDMHICSTFYASLVLYSASKHIRLSLQIFRVISLSDNDFNMIVLKGRRHVTMIYVYYDAMRYSVMHHTALGSRQPSET